jgi:hypothetical protein
LRREFGNLQMKFFESIEQFLIQFMNVVNQIRLNVDERTDQGIVVKILRSLRIKFNNIVVAIRESKDLSKLSIDELFGSIKNTNDIWERQRKRAK